MFQNFEVINFIVKQRTFSVLERNFMEGDNLIILTEEVEKLQIQILPAD